MLCFLLGKNDIQNSTYIFKTLLFILQFILVLNDGKALRCTGQYYVHENIYTFSITTHPTLIAATAHMSCRFA